MEGEGRKDREAESPHSRLTAGNNNDDDNVESSPGRDNHAAAAFARPITYGLPTLYFSHYFPFPFNFSISRLL
jgi:hypothetical protein